MDQLRGDARGDLEPDALPAPSRLRRRVHQRCRLRQLPVRA